MQVLEECCRCQTINGDICCLALFKFTEYATWFGRATSSIICYTCALFRESLRQRFSLPVHVVFHTREKWRNYYFYIYKMYPTLRFRGRCLINVKLST